MQRLIKAATMVVCLVGCTTFPPTPSATVDASATTFAVLTELYCAVTAPEFQTVDHTGKPISYFATDDNWAAAVDLNLSASVEGSVSPLVSLLGPFNPARAFPAGGVVGSYTAAIGGSFDQTRTNLREYKIIVFLKTFILGNPTSNIPNWRTLAETHGWPVNCLDPNRGGTFLEGRLGLREWLLPAVNTEVATQQFAPPPASSAPADLSLDRTTGVTGQAVNIKGTNLSGGKVTFGYSANVTSSSDRRLTAIAPKRGDTVTVSVANANGSATAPQNFKYTDVENKALSAEDLQKLDLQEQAFSRAVQPLADAMIATAGATSPAGGAQAPTIAETITFIIKATGTVGPSFVLSRVSGGSSSFLSLSRTDNNYVNIVLTPATYCWTALDYSSGAPKCNPLVSPSVYGAAIINAQFKAARAQPRPVDIQSAVDRINNALINLNLARSLTIPP
jgi:hypothetical protein